MINLNVLWSLSADSAFEGAVYLEIQLGITFKQALAIVSGLQQYIFAQQDKSFWRHFALCE